MPTGSCLCGNLKIEYKGEPTYTACLHQAMRSRISTMANTPEAFCHCTDDRKINNTQVFQIPKANFAITSGEPNIFTKKSDHGREIHTHFCPDCGTAMFRTGGSPNMADFIGLRAGVLDDQSLLDKAPMMEVYVERRQKWLRPVEGAVQLNEEYEVVQ